MGEPLPRFSDDDVVDLIVKEAVMLKGLEHEAERQKEAKMREWRKAPVGSGTPGFSM